MGNKQNKPNPESIPADLNPTNADPPHSTNRGTTKKEKSSHLPNNQHEVSDQFVKVSLNDVLPSSPPAVGELKNDTAEKEMEMTTALQALTQENM